MNNEKKQEFTVRITNANRSELVVILYDMILTYLDDAKNYLKEDKADLFCDEVKKAQECIRELISALDMQYEISSQLARLYLYASRNMTRSLIKADAKVLKDAEMVIKRLRESFVEVAKQDDSPVLMGNTQEIYAGLTYGKGSLNENVSDEGSSRGFFV